MADPNNPNDLIGDLDDYLRRRCLPSILPVNIFTEPGYLGRLGYKHRLEAQQKQREAEKKRIAEARPKWDDCDTGAKWTPEAYMLFGGSIALLMLLAALGPFGLGTGFVGVGMSAGVGAIVARLAKHSARRILKAIASALPIFALPFSG